jgi:hypothetical protein
MIPFPFQYIKNAVSHVLQSGNMVVFADFFALNLLTLLSNYAIKIVDPSSVTLLTDTPET